MKRFFINCMFMVLLTGFFVGSAESKPVIAFGYLNNSSNNLNFNYLENIFPNSFASSISAVFKVDVMKPLQIDEYLKKKKTGLKKNYETYELPAACRAIGADLFITGSFTPLPNNQIRIILHLYNSRNNEIFTFVNTGRMETEIFKLVDRISTIVINFMKEDSYYKTRAIPPGSRIAVISNINGSELNSLYYPLMKKGYPIVSIQSNEIGTAHDTDMFTVFRYIITRNGSLSTASDWRGMKFYQGPWTGKNYKEYTATMKRIARSYDTEYTETKARFTEKLHSPSIGRADVLLIVGFSENRKECWLRAVDLKELELIWMQSGIRHEGLLDEPAMTIGTKIADNLGKEAESPFKETGRPTGNK